MQMTAPKRCLQCNGQMFLDGDFCSRCRARVAKAQYTEETLTLYRHENPSPFRPGSEDKIRTLAARYAAGMKLWHDSDAGRVDDE